jgi:anti-sigma factor RsiW
VDGHDRLVKAFLAGDLGPADARRFDEHLLECEACWRGVREDRAGRQAAELLRQPAPAGLADRVAFAVEVAVTAGTAGQRPGRAAGRLPWRLAGGGTLVLGAMVTLIALPLPGGRPSGAALA